MSKWMPHRLGMAAVCTLLLTAIAWSTGSPRLAGASGEPERLLAIPDAVVGDSSLFIPDPLPPSPAGEGVWGPVDRHDRAGGGAQAPGVSPDAPSGTWAPWWDGRFGPALPGAEGSLWPGGQSDGLDDLLATSTLTSRQDTFVSARFPDTNYGSQSPMFVGETSNFGATRSLFSFDMNDLPRNQAVREARVELYLREAGPSGDSGRDVVFRRITLGRNSNGTCRSSWNQNDPTWNNFPSYNDSRVATTSVGTTRERYSWGLTDLTRRWRLAFWWPTNECNGGIYMQGYETAGSFRGFDTREGSNRPQLVIDHVTDTTPPIAAVDPIGPWTNTPDASNPNRAPIRLTWQGDDPSPATGIDFFQLFARNSNQPQNPWQLVGDQLQTFGGTFQGDNGIRWEFVIYPTDQAGNIQPGKPPETATLVDLNFPVTTVTPLPAYEPGPFELTWTAQDFPNAPGLANSGVSHYDVQWNIGGGAWGDLAFSITQPKILFTPPAQNLLYQFRVRSVDTAGNIEPWSPAQAQTFVDGIAPVISFVRAPFVLGARTFDVSWLGDDGTGSGVASYDLQMRVDLGPWEDWVTNTATTSRSQTGVFGKTYSFRARARDRAGNLGAYPEQPQLVYPVIDPDTLKFNIRLPVVSK